MVLRAVGQLLNSSIITDYGPSEVPCATHFVSHDLAVGASWYALPSTISHRQTSSTLCMIDSNMCGEKFGLDFRGRALRAYLASYGQHDQWRSPRTFTAL